MTEQVITIEKNVHLERLLTNDREMQKKMQKAVRKALQTSRSKLAREARSGLRMESDPRAAYRAIKSTVYRRMLGGNVSILAKRRAGSKAYKSDLSPNRGRARGGNRMQRSQRTEDMMSYYGSDRGFILRFLNQGTAKRIDSKRNGNRGSIMARNWFGSASQRQLSQAAEEMERIIDQAIAEAEV